MLFGLLFCPPLSLARVPPLWPLVSGEEAPSGCRTAGKQCWRGAGSWQSSRRAPRRRLPRGQRPRGLISSTLHWYSSPTGRRRPRAGPPARSIWGSPRFPRDGCGTSLGFIYKESRVLGGFGNSGQEPLPPERIPSLPLGKLFQPLLRFVTLQDGARDRARSLQREAQGGRAERVGGVGTCRRASEKARRGHAHHLCICRLEPSRRHQEVLAAQHHRSLRVFGLYVRRVRQLGHRKHRRQQKGS
ncbi:hypothetical protein LZ32DRAFT_80618 [Colletotrichum eremochloae]|nr:hypothetical protein LZ32DRAFT_80618 [Colletotrichum eremochloae]